MKCFLFLKLLTLPRDRRVAGFSLLEFSLSFIVIVPMLIATLDLTKLFQARSSAKAAVNTALRCATVTDDPSCSIATPISNKAAYKVRLSSAESIIPLVSYTGEVKYIEGPKFKVGPLKALVLEHGFTKVGSVGSLKATVPIMSVVADVSYSSIDSYVVPQIQSDSLSAKQPRFADGHAVVRIGPASRSAEASFISTKEGSGPVTPFSKASISEEFSVPAIFAQSNCIGGQSYPGSLVGSHNCFGTDAKGKRFVRGIVHVEGNGNASSKDVCGRALLELQVLENSSWRLAQDLSGQSFQGSANNFIPRGYKNTSAEVKLVNGVIDQYYQTSSGEIASEAFQGEIKFELDKKYRIVVRTQVDTQLDSWNATMKKCSAGQVSYQVSGGNVYFAKINTINKQVNCSETIPACSVPSSCSEAAIPQVLSSGRLPPEIFASILKGAPKTGSPTKESIIKDCGINLVSQEHFNQLLSSGAPVGSCSCKASSFIKGPAIPPVTFGPVVCPQANKGVSDEASINGFVTNSLQAQKICPLSAPVIGTYQIPESELIRTWQTKEILVSESAEYEPKDCEELSSERIIEKIWSQKYSQYLMPLLQSANVSRQASKSLLQSGKESPNYPAFDPADPAELLKESRYGCGEFRVKSVRAESLEKQREQSASLFETSEPRLNCSGGSDPKAWKTMLSNHLRQVYSQVEDAFFIPGYRNSGQIVNSACGSSPAYSSSEESIICNPFFTLNPALSSSRLLDELSDGKELPAICSEPCHSCQLELASISAGPASGSQRQKEKALMKARAQLQAFSPWLGRDCGEKDCVSLDLEDQGTRVRGSASIKVPLFTKVMVTSFLGEAIFDGKDHFELRYSSEKTYEKEIAKFKS